MNCVAVPAAAHFAGEAIQLLVVGVVETSDSCARVCGPLTTPMRIFTVTGIDTDAHHDFHALRDGVRTQHQRRAKRTGVHAVARATAIPD